jgi:hypothetical protein
MEKVVVTYGNGVPKLGVVRMKPIAVENAVTPATELGDYYISRKIMGLLGLKDSDSVKVTFEKV